MVKSLLVVAAASAVSCAVDNPPMQIGSLDREYFRCNVQPVLAARCAFPACHGSARRPLSLYAVGRMRYQVGWDRPTEPLTATELESNFRIASGFSTATATGDVWLLVKPLDTAAGGYYHRGADLYGGQDVFLDTTDPDYQTLASWIAGAQGCAP